MRQCTASCHGAKHLHVWKADTFLLRLRGLLGRTLGQDEALLLVPCRQVHCCGMKMPIDVVYLNRENSIIKITQNMKPGTFGKYVRGAHSVLELTCGKAEKLQLLVGDIITFET